MSAIQFMTDAEGNRISAVIPIELFNKLAAESELDEFFEPVPFEADDNDDETIPGYYPGRRIKHGEKGEASKGDA